MTSSGKQFWTALIPVLVIGALCALLLTTVDRCTREHIESNRQQLALKVIKEILPVKYDNDLFNDRIEISDKTNFMGKVMVYRARYHGVPVGAAILPVIAKGYKARIELAVGLSLKGTITGVRVIKQQETEGQGDRIDQHKSDWILGFDGRSLENTPAGDWAVQSDGGDFDQLSGATISPRGVINAVKKTLDYYAVNKERLMGSDLDMLLINRQQ